MLCLLLLVSDKGGVVMLGWLATLLTQLFGRTLSDNLSRWIVLKAVAVFLMTVVLPIVLVNCFDFILAEIMDAAFAAGRDYIHGGSMDVVLTFTGFGAWAASQAHIPEIVSVIASALSVRWVLNFVPFVG